MSAVLRPRVLIFLSCLIAQASVFADDPIEDRGAVVERLEQSGLNLYVEINRLTDHGACPAENWLPIYIGTDLDTFSLAEVSVKVDDEPGQIKSFGPTEAKSLAHDSLYQLLCIPPSIGPHQLHIEVKLREADAASSTAATSLADDKTFETESQTTAIALSVYQKPLFSAPALRLQVLRGLPASNTRTTSVSALQSFIGGAPKGTYLLGDADDPNVRSAHYLAGIGERFSALTKLMRIRIDHPNDLLAPDFNFELATSLLDVGLLQAASNAALGAHAAGEQRSRIFALRLRIALAFYQQGALARAENLLAKLRPHIDDHQLIEWQDVQSRILLAQGRYADATSLLLTTENKANYPSYVRYFNLGVALLKTDHSDQGVTVLDRVGKVPTDNLLLGTLRDRANLVLGYYFLKQLQGATAIPILQRISSSGPYANRALLGLGWAWLAPSGSKQHKSAIGDERTVGRPPEAVLNYLPNGNDRNLYQRYELRPFERARVSDDESIRLKQALTDWAALKSRDTTDPAVQEGLLAIGFALDRLGAHDDAGKYYERGVIALDATRAELQATESYCSDAHWIDQLLQQKASDEPGDPIVVSNFPPPRFAVFLDDVIASDGFQQALKNYRDLLLLENMLQAAETKLVSISNGNPAVIQTIASLRARIAVMRPEIIAASVIEGGRARAMAIDDLEAQQRLSRTLSEAGHFELARAYDRSSPHAQP